MEQAAQPIVQQDKTASSSHAPKKEGSFSYFGIYTQLPALRQLRQAEAAGLHPQAEEALKHGAQVPARGAGIPAPARLAVALRVRIDVGGQDVGLRAVFGALLRQQSQQNLQPLRPAAPAQQGQGQPYGPCLLYTSPSPRDA